MPRFAANLSMMFTDRPFVERFAAAAAADFAGVEFLFPYDHLPSELGAACRASGVSTVLFNLPPGDWARGERGLAALPGREAEFRTLLDRALPYLHELGSAQVHAMAGIPPADVDPARCRAAYVANLAYAAGILGSIGVDLLIEPINQRDMPGYFLNRQTAALAIIDEVSADNLRLQCDLYHLQISEGDLSVRLRHDIGRIGHVQIAGVPDRHEPDHGEVNYPYLFELLDTLGYAGWVGCEYQPRGRTEDGLGWLRRTRGNPASRSRDR